MTEPTDRKPTLADEVDAWTAGQREGQVENGWVKLDQETGKIRPVFEDELYDLSEKIRASDPTNDNRAYRDATDASIPGFLDPIVHDPKLDDAFQPGNEWWHRPENNVAAETKATLDASQARSATKPPRPHESLGLRAAMSPALAQSMANHPAGKMRLQ